MGVRPKINIVIEEYNAVRIGGISKSPRQRGYGYKIIINIGGRKFQENIFVVKPKLVKSSQVAQREIILKLGTAISAIGESIKRMNLESSEEEYSPTRIKMKKTKKTKTKELIGDDDENGNIY